MSTESTVALDETDWRILAVLQRDGRLSFADLAREVAMSPSAVTERVRRLEAAAVITSYRAVVDPHRVGLGILALIRLRVANSSYRQLDALLESTPEVIEAHHVTGEDCFVLKVAARSMRHLEEVTGRVAGLGSTTTSVVYSSPLPARGISADAAVPGAASPPGRSARGRSAQGGSPRGAARRQPVAN